MKILKTVLIVILAIIAIPLIIALFVSKDYKVESEIVINKPSQQVFDYVKLLKNQDNYNKWVMADPNMKKEFRGTDGTVGFVYSWNGNDEVGEGEQEIKTIDEGKEIVSELRFKRPMESVATTYTKTVADGNNTRVIWGMQGKSPYPFNFMNLFMSGMLQKDQITSLNTLKEIIEKQ
jgi:uncharacterized protein YndB with AHSA1/START domain